jgi:Na+-translocating ferredoxin:NAD+ oxidoreductase RnfG subunit/Pyruvate/2-oxoacid:ferredoxin oxidoreductase delta subunit
MRFSPLKGTRYLVLERAVTIVGLALLVLMVFVGTYVTPMVSPPQSTDNVASPSQAELFKIEYYVRDFVNKTVGGIPTQLLNSTSEVPYYIVTSAKNRRQVLGLVYLTTDVLPESTYGYGSEIEMLVFVNQTGTIKGLTLWLWSEPRGYLVTDEWINALINRSVYEDLKVGQDVDAVTGATYTCLGITSGVREAGRRVVDDHRTQSSKRSEPLSQVLASAMAMIQKNDLLKAAVTIGMLAAAIVAYGTVDRRLEYVVLVLAVVFNGIYTRRMISIVDLTALMQANIPPLFSNLYWYALYGGTLVTSLIWGRLYCGYLCPFGAFTHLINKISPIKRRVPIKLHSKLVYVKYPILGIVVIGVLAGNGWITGLEPFETFFFLRGDWWMWAIMIGAVVLSIPFHRFYCHYVCPAGAVLSIAGRARVKEIKRWPECHSCKVCEQACPEGAILGPRITVLECMNCRECEKNYLDTKRCPHYVLARSS